jgi:hypothetical protein
MSELDYVIREGDLVIKQKATFNLLELYNTIKSWFKLNKYTLFEKKYEDTIKEESRYSKIKFVSSKKIDDYTKFRIDIGLDISNYKTIESKKNRLVEGTVTIKFESYLDSDYEERWENNPFYKFFRGIFDKIISQDKFSKYEEELREETYELYDKIKAFLNIVRFQ